MMLQLNALMMRPKPLVKFKLIKIFEIFSQIFLELLGIMERNNFKYSFILFNYYLKEFMVFITRIIRDKHYFYKLAKLTFPQV